MIIRYMQVSVSPEEKLLLVVICTLSTVFPVDTKVVFEVIGPRTRPVGVSLILYYGITTKLICDPIQELRKQNLVPPCLEIL